MADGLAVSRLVSTERPALSFSCPLAGTLYRLTWTISPYVDVTSFPKSIPPGVPSEHASTDQHWHDCN